MRRWRRSSVSRRKSAFARRTAAVGPRAQPGRAGSTERATGMSWGQRGLGWRAIAATLTATVLSAGLVTIAAQPAAAATRIDPRKLPALPSTPAGPVKVSVPTGDMSHPPSMTTKPPGTFDPSHAKLEADKTTATSKLYDNPAGSKTLVTSTGPARIKDPNAPGGWSDIDLSLSP